MTLLTRFRTRLGHSLRPLAGAALVAGLTGLAACGGSTPAAAGAGPGGAMPAMPVQATTLVSSPVERTSDYVGVVKSRRSTTIQPQVDGFVTGIRVASGDHVKPGDVLLEIDAATQEAAVASLQSQRAARQADATLAGQQAERVKHLLDIGAASTQDYDQAAAAQKSAEAALQSIDAQIRQQQNQLAYYRVTAPTAGSVGDIPVRKGDRVTTSTVLTTIDDNAGLEIYVNVPVERAPDLHPGLSIRLLGQDDHVLATVPISFVSPAVDDATQTLLVKAELGDHSSSFRASQFVRARIVWTTAPGLTVPVVATSRINGQYFVYVVQAAGTGTVAHQQAVVVGSIIGNDYVVESGLKAGDRVIVSGLQKIGDGAPVQVMPAAPAAPEPAGPTSKGGR